MAQQTTTVLTDDIDGGKAVETIPFALDGAHYEIDLSAKNAKNLRKSLAEFVAAGRKVKTLVVPGRTATRGSKKTAASPAKANKEDLAAIRAWAIDNGIPVAARGRIAATVKEQYAARTTETA